ncbi:MAG: hypothetical protein WCT45_01135 [Candidatus Paceibacterota bacterium]|jgi:hypothetical protein
MRRTLTLAAIALVVLGLLVAAYFYFFTGTATVTVAPEAGGTLPLAGQQTGGAGTTQTETPAGTVTSVPVVVSSRLVQISAGPVALGAAVVDAKAKDASTTPETSINFIERVSGNVFTYLVRAKTLTRVNNKTIPGIQSASWLPNGSLAFVRYLSGNNFSTINTYALAATSTNGFFLSQNLAGIDVSATGILTTTSGVNGSVISLVRTDGTRPTTVFTTPLASLRASFAGKNQYLAFTKPSASLSGDAFLVDGAGHFSRISGPHNGLVALASPSGKLLLVSYVAGGAMHLELVETTTGNVVPLPIATIADKCVWAADDSNIYCGVPVTVDPSSAYPDDWYQGVVHFSDRIWKIHVVGRYAQLVLDFSQADKGDLDAESLAVNPAQTVLVFTNKNDGSLWSFSL